MNFVFFVERIFVIVGAGRDAKIKGNQFLWSEIPVEDFRLTLKVKQVPHPANAGIQLRLLSKIPMASLQV
ncbi:MAG: hypothetical protein ACKVHR_10520 [Pirellulales bacterium]